VPKSAETLLKRASVNNTLIQLNIPELRWRGNTLLREVQTITAAHHLSFFRRGRATSDVEVPISLWACVELSASEDGIDPVLTPPSAMCARNLTSEVIEVDVSQIRQDILYVNQLVLPERLFW